MWLVGSLTTWLIASRKRSHPAGPGETVNISSNWSMKSTISAPGPTLLSSSHSASSSSRRRLCLPVSSGCRPPRQFQSSSDTVEAKAPGEGVLEEGSSRAKARASAVASSAAGSAPGTIVTTMGGDSPARALARNVGINPARTRLDLPLPLGPTTARKRAKRACSAMRASIRSTRASLPKKSWASDSLNALNPL